MIAPRNRTEHVPAPVLFRLPHLQTHTAANPTEPEPQPPAAAELKTHHSTILTHRDWLSKPPVILGAMLIVAGGSWFAGRQMSAPPAADAMTTTASLSASTADQRPSNAATQSNAAPLSNAATELSTLGHPQPSPASDATSVQQPALPESNEEAAVVADTAEDFYLPEDVPLPELPAIAAAQDATATDSGELAAAGEPAAAERFAEMSAEVLNQPAEPAEVVEVAASEPTAPPAEQPAPAAAAEESAEVASAAPAAEPEAAAAPEAAAVAEAEPTPPAETEGKKLRRVLSRTPHDIPDWSKYLTGANNPIKAASAPGDASSGTPQPKHERAFYYEQD